MSHKDKLCETAVTAHIETCHPQCSYTPLLVHSRSFRDASDVTHGISETVEKDIAERLEETHKDIIASANKLRDQFTEITASTGSKRSADVKNLQSVMQKLQPGFEAQLTELSVQQMDEARNALIAEAGDAFDLSNGPKAIEMRMPHKYAEIKKASGKFEKFNPIRLPNVRELDQLGLFFTEAVCQRAEGLSYSPCGEEMTILPGERIRRSNTVKTVQKDEQTGKETISESLLTTTQNDAIDTFESTYETSLIRETDVSLSAEAGFKIPFKVFSLQLDLNASVDVNTVMKETAKESSKSTRKRFDEAKRSLQSSTSLSQSSSTQVTTEAAYSHDWHNDTDMPMTFIKRQPWCKKTVIHKRTNVQMAWSGCIENPGRDLCTPDNLEDKLKPEIEAIRQKWSEVEAPSEFGKRPTNQKLCTAEGFYSTALGQKRDMTVSAMIPAGYIYDGTPVIDIVSSTTQNQPDTTYIRTQPTIGATGGVSFGITVDFKNKVAHREEAQVRVCFMIAPLAAQDWDDQVAAWQQAQADLEIAALLEQKREEMDKFLFSEQAHAAIIRRIMEDYFGVNVNGDDCCKFIKRLHGLFDFNMLCYTLYPAWNQSGVGCQSSQPPTMLTAKCLQFHLPIAAGREFEALSLLGSIGAVPWSWSMLMQYIGYVNHINNMRQTLFNRDFDPTGWNKKFDDPKGYQLTPYDTANPLQWYAAHETEMNYQVIDAFTIEVPMPGYRIDPRSPLCS